MLTTKNRKISPSCKALKYACVIYESSLCISHITFSTRQCEKMPYIVLLCKVLHTRLSFCWKGNMICVKSCCSPPSWQFELLVSPNSTTALRRHLLGKMAILNIWHCWRNFFATIILTPLPSTVNADGVFWHIALCFTSCFCFSHHIGQKTSRLR